MALAAIRRRHNFPSSSYFRFCRLYSLGHTAGVIIAFLFIASALVATYPSLFYYKERLFSAANADMGSGMGGGSQGEGMLATKRRRAATSNSQCSSWSSHLTRRQRRAARCALPVAIALARLHPLLWTARHSPSAAPSSSSASCGALHNTFHH